MDTDEVGGVNFGSKHVSVIIRAIRGSYSCVTLLSIGIPSFDSG